ncbi:hypothetical protein DSECCO2_476560 [anaerobic digester metagenome]
MLSRIALGLSNEVIAVIIADIKINTVIKVGATGAIKAASHSDKIPIGMFTEPFHGRGKRNIKTPSADGIANFMILFLFKLFTSYSIGSLHFYLKIFIFSILSNASLSLSMPNVQAILTYPSPQSPNAIPGIVRT